MSEGKGAPGVIVLFGVTVTVYPPNSKPESWRIPELPPEKAARPLAALIKTLDNYDEQSVVTIYSNTVYGCGSISFRNQTTPAPLERVRQALERFLGELKGGSGEM